jgi:acyl-coenzyme A thioesterase PaaI-like protein
VTDIPTGAATVPTRLGVSARFADDVMTLELAPQPETLHHGVVRASVLSFVIDAQAGIVLDQDPDFWTLTTDMTVRMRPMPAPERIYAVNTILRRGRRSATSLVELFTQDAVPIATGAIGFAHVPRKATDPPKPIVRPDGAPNLFRARGLLSQPLREEAGIEVIDAAAGVVQVDVTSALRNPAGTLQGAMVALLAEAAVEDMVATLFASPVVVTELDIRYLGPAQVGPVRTRSRLLGDGPDAPVQVELIDQSTGKITTLAYARAVTAS